LFRYASTLIDKLMRASSCDVDFVTEFAVDHGIDRDTLAGLVVPLLLEQPSRGSGGASDSACQAQIEHVLAHVSDKTKVLAVLDARHRQMVGPYVTPLSPQCVLQPFYQCRR
jgi:hypothetical protein